MVLVKNSLITLRMEMYDKRFDMWVGKRMYQGKLVPFSCKREDTIYLLYNENLRIKFSEDGDNVD